MLALAARRLILGSELGSGALFGRHHRRPVCYNIIDIVLHANGDAAVSGEVSHEAWHPIQFFTKKAPYRQGSG